MGTSSGGIQSRTLRVRLRMMLPAYGGQESDCISARFAHIPPEEVPIPPRKRRAKSASEERSGGVTLSQDAVASFSS